MFGYTLVGSCWVACARPLACHVVLCTWVQGLAWGRVGYWHSFVFAPALDAKLFTFSLNLHTHVMLCSQLSILTHTRKHLKQQINRNSTVLKLYKDVMICCNQNRGTLVARLLLLDTWYATPETKAHFMPRQWYFATKTTYHIGDGVKKWRLYTVDLKNTFLTFSQRLKFQYLD